MRALPLAVLPLAAALCLHTSSTPQDPLAAPTQGLPGLNVAQDPCALHVSVRSHALNEPMAFGRDPEDVAVHWNMCSSGNMVACATTATANGDSVQTGIPWPY